MSKDLLVLLQCGRLDSVGIEVASCRLPEVRVQGLVQGHDGGEAQLFH